jgi:hypothetical protein
MFPTWQAAARRLVQLLVVLVLVVLVLLGCYQVGVWVLGG